MFPFLLHFICEITMQRSTLKKLAEKFCMNKPTTTNKLSFACSIIYLCIFNPRPVQFA